MNVQGLASLYALLCGMLTLLIAMGNVQGDMIDTSGLKAWETCAMCHGVDGVSHMDRFPKLAAQPLAYLTKQLRDFKLERRLNDNGTMTAMAGSKMMKTLRQAAKYYSRLPPPPVVKRSPSAIDRNAQILFENGDPRRNLPACRSCHGTTGQFPRLKAQHQAYLAKQLMDFRGNARRNDPGGVMRSIAKILSPKEIVDLAMYLAAQPRQKEMR